MRHYIILSLIASTNLAIAETFPEWKGNTEYEFTNIVTYKNNWYTPREAHTSQSNLNPEFSPALWKRIEKTPDIGLTTKFVVETFVYNAGVIWRARKDQIVKAGQIFDPSKKPYDWQAYTGPKKIGINPLRFQAGQNIVFNSIQYKARVAHVSYEGANWNPGNRPVLWQTIGPINKDTQLIAGTAPLQSSSQNQTASIGQNSASCNRIDFQYPFSKNSPWKLKPVDPVLGTEIIPKSTYYPEITAGNFSTGVFKTSSTDLPLTVYPELGQQGISDPDSGQLIKQVIIPAWPKDVKAATGSDGHAEIIDEQRRLVHSFWRLKNDNGTWRARQWTVTSLDGTGWGSGAQRIVGARAAGVPTTGGLIRKHEIDDGKPLYEHALAMSLTYNGLSGTNTYDYPATATDNDAASSNTGYIPMGSLMMLPKDFDVASLATDELKKIAKTLQTYGARVVDRNHGTPFVIYAEIDSGWRGTNVKGWDNNYAAGLEKIRAALKRVTHANTWLNQCGEYFDLNAANKDTQLLSMRGPWKLMEGANLGIFSTATQAVEWGPTQAKVVQRNTDSTGISKVDWAKPEQGLKYKLTAIATNGASCRLELRGKSFDLIYTSPQLYNGQVEYFTWPNATYVIPIAISGENTEKSSVQCQLIQS